MEELITVNVTDVTLQYLRITPNISVVVIIITGQICPQVLHGIFFSFYNMATSYIGYYSQLTSLTT